MKDSGIDGYNMAALKQEALKNAFYKQDANGQMQLDPDSFDPSVDHVAEAIKKNPLAVTTDEAFDDFAKKAEKFKTASDITSYTPTGTTYRHKANLIAPAYMTPETVIDPKTKEEVTTGFVPKHDIATEQGNPLFHTFDKGGKQVREPVRLLDEGIFDKGLKPAMQDRIRGMVQQHLNEYSSKSGKQIDINSPEAKLVGRAIAYDMLNVRSRDGGTIGNMDEDGKPSGASVSLNVHESPAYLKNVEDIAAAAKRGRNSEPTATELANQYKRNPAEAIADVFTGKEDIAGNSSVKLNGKVTLPGGKTKDVKDYQVIDVTSSMTGGGLKSGRGEDYKFKSVYYKPDSRALIVEEEQSKPNGGKTTNFNEIPEANIGQFINQIAEANGIPKPAVKSILEKIGYSGGKFKGSNKPAAQPAAPDDPAAADFKARKNSWRVALKKSTGQSNP
jgi:hypothetical protein